MLFEPWFDTRVVKVVLTRQNLQNLTVLETLNAKNARFLGLANSFFDDSLENDPIRGWLVTQQFVQLIIQHLACHFLRFRGFRVREFGADSDQSLAGFPHGLNPCCRFLITAVLYELKSMGYPC